MRNTGLYSSNWNLDYTRVETFRADGRNLFKDDLPTLRSLKTRRRGRGYAEACSARVKAGKRRSGPSPYHVTIRIIKIHKARLAHSHFSTPRAAHHIFIDALECTHASRGTPYATRCIDFGAHLSVPGRGYPTVSAKIHTYVYTPSFLSPLLPFEARRGAVVEHRRRRRRLFHAWNIIPLLLLLELIWRYIIAFHVCIYVYISSCNLSNGRFWKEERGTDCWMEILARGVT